MVPAPLLASPPDTDQVTGSRSARSERGGKLLHRSCPARWLRCSRCNWCRWCWCRGRWRIWRWRGRRLRCCRRNRPPPAGRAPAESQPAAAATAGKPASEHTNPDDSRKGRAQSLRIGPAAANSVAFFRVTGLLTSSKTPPSLKRDSSTATSGLPFSIGTESQEGPLSGIPATPTCPATR